MKQIEEIIQNTTEEEQEKVDWTRAWSTKYPVLATYQKEVDIPKYATEIRRMFTELQADYNYSEQDAMLVLKDILAHEYMDNRPKKNKLMNQDHKADSSLPVCRSRKANYYVQSGYSFQMRHRLMAYIDRLIEKNERIYEFRAEGRLNKVAIEKEVADHIVQKLHEQGRSSVGIKTCSNRKLGIYRIEIS